MQWTKDTPTEAGWYWQRRIGEGSDFADMVEVVIISGVANGLGLGFEEYYEFRPNVFEWLGPITPEMCERMEEKEGEK